ncbi:MAG: T9SS type A sorting domain-containing protein, partial [Bacteroidota bacterium]|nr:T9SS type A sorting domain-containing protein [Bacteroidota bacterium]
RILGAVPYTTSQDNGSDFSICTTPRFYGIEWAPTAISAGISERFDIISPTPLATYTWILGADASPDTIVGNRANIIFLSGGDKIITINATTTCGCSVSKTYSVHVYDCSKPVIPKRSIVMNNDSATTLSNSVFWVNPGVKLYVIGSYDTVFQEPGSTVIARGNESVFYLKTGSSISNEGIYSTFILADGSSITGFDQYMDGKVTCSTLDFDYTDAPPNAAHPLGVVQARTLASLTLTPNPTAGSLTVQNLPLGVSEVTVLNILGESIQEYKNVRSTELTLDLSKFAPGTYYIRFETPNSVITKMVVKQ